jgi:HAD superfamily hydrolase (TIGR01549 family)
MVISKTPNKNVPDGVLTDIKVVAFDCDGVMFNSAKANQAYYNQILNHFDLPEMTARQFAYAHMHTVDESLAFLFSNPDMLTAAQRYRRSMKYVRFVKYMEIEPHLKALLARLRPKYKTAIATNRTDTMPYVLAEYGLEEMFDLVVSALDVAHPKPHPEQLLKIIAFFDIGPANILYIGDSEVDAAAAASAGVPMVAYNNLALAADFHIDSLQQLQTILPV